MQTCHIDGVELECQNFNMWKQAISRWHEVNKISMILQSLNGEFIARAHRDHEYFGSRTCSRPPRRLGVRAALMPRSPACTMAARGEILTQMNFIFL
jgi:hypothetical protein